MTFEAIGTTWQIDIYTPLTSEKEAEVFDLIKKRIDEFDKVYSRFREDSVVTQMSKMTGEYILPEDSKLLFEIYFDLYKKTGGLFTPLVGDLLSDAGYDAKYSLEQKSDLKTPDELKEVLEFNYPKLLIKKPALLDFGAGGKGYLVDLVAKVLEENNISKYCIDAGGDILHKNNESLRVGLENPNDFSQVIGVSNLYNRSLCGSAGSRRKWEDFNHIMNPKTLESVKDIVAVWVVADTALLADSLATCLFFVSPDDLVTEYNFECVILSNNGKCFVSKGFDGDVFGING